MVGRAGGGNDQKRESGKMGGGGIVTLAFLFYSSVSAGMGRLLEFSWALRFFFFFLFLFGLPVLTEDSHLEFHEPALHLASAHVCLGLVREWAGIKTSGKRRAPQQRAWNVLNEALSVWGNQQNCVYSCKSHLGNQQSQRSLKLLGVCYDGAAWSMNTNTTSVSVCVYTEIMLCVHFAHVLGSTYFYTKKEAISLT